MEHKAKKPRPTAHRRGVVGGGRDLARGLRSKLAPGVSVVDRMYELGGKLEITLDCDRGTIVFSTAWTVPPGPTRPSRQT